MSWMVRKKTLFYEEQMYRKLCATNSNPKRGWWLSTSLPLLLGSSMEEDTSKRSIFWSNLILYLKQALQNPTSMCHTLSLPIINWKFRVCLNHDKHIRKSIFLQIIRQTTWFMRRIHHGALTISVAVMLLLSSNNLHRFLPPLAQFI